MAQTMPQQTPLAQRNLDITREEFKVEIRNQDIWDDLTLRREWARFLDGVCKHLGAYNVVGWSCWLTGGISGMIFFPILLWKDAKDLYRNKVVWDEMERRGLTRSEYPFSRALGKFVSGHIPFRG